MVACALAQPAVLNVCYFSSDSTQALGCGCSVSTRVPFADGTSLCVMWDANHATHPGPDTADVQPTQGSGHGETNYLCTTFNGEEGGLGAGFFCVDPALAISDLVASDSSWYYLTICAEDCRWYSASFQAVSGLSEINLTPSDWTCSDSTCGGSLFYTIETQSEMSGLTIDGPTVDGLTIRPIPSTNQLIFHWPAVCNAVSYKVYSSTSAEGPFDTFVDSTSGTNLIISQPSPSKLFYAVKSCVPWDQIGIDHNRGLGCTLMQLTSEWDSTWTEARIRDSVKSHTLEFFRDSTCYNYDLANWLLSDTGAIRILTDTSLVKWVAPNTQSVLDFHVTQETRAHYFDAFDSLHLVSQREKQFIIRLFDIVYFDSLSTTSLLLDSLGAFEKDFLGVNWEHTEILCPAMVSLVLHSRDFSTEGWTFMDGDSARPISALGPDPIYNVLKADYDGFIAGAGGMVVTMWVATQQLGPFTTIAIGIVTAAGGWEAAGGIIAGAGLGVGAVASVDSWRTVVQNGEW
jgi:hypothetical protein